MINSSHLQRYLVAALAMAASVLCADAAVLRVTFDPNSSEVKSGTKTRDYEVGKQYTLPTDVFTRPGYVFAGWSETPFGAKRPMRYSPLNAGSTTFYAIWLRPGCYGLVFLDCASSDYVSVPVNGVGKLKAVPSPDSAHSGKAFAGWSFEGDTRSPGTKLYDPGILVFNLPKKEILGVSVQATTNDVIVFSAKWK